MIFVCGFAVGLLGAGNVVPTGIAAGAAVGDMMESAASILPQAAKPFVLGGLRASAASYGTHTLFGRSLGGIFGSGAPYLLYIVGIPFFFLGLIFLKYVWRFGMILLGFIGGKVWKLVEKVPVLGPFALKVKGIFIREVKAARSEHTIFVLDRSGSMAGSPFRELVEAYNAHNDDKKEQKTALKISLNKGALPTLASRALPTNVNRSTLR